MQRLPCKGRRHLEIDNSYKVLCLCPPQTIQGLQWFLDRPTNGSPRRYRLFPASLSQLAQPPEHDLVLLSVDLGQPVPAENLKRLAKSPRGGRPGLAAFMHPTPQQLLALFEVRGWSALAWDGVSFEKLAERLEQLAQDSEQEKARSAYLDMSRAWIESRRLVPARLQLLNPPTAWEQPTDFVLDPQKKTFVIGAQNSRADVRLPIGGIQDLAEFAWNDSAWSLRVRADSVPIKSTGDLRSIRTGDQVEVGAWTFQCLADARVEELASLARKSGLLSHSFGEGLGEIKSLEDALVRALLSAANGEIRVTSKLRHGSIYLREGRIEAAVAGAVSGEKGLLRIFSWEKPEWRFNPEKRPALRDTDLDLDLAGFRQVFGAWSERWAKVGHLMPPGHMKLAADPRRFGERQEWSRREYLVLAGISEFHLVRDVFNNCHLSDVDIVEALVDLRRHGVIAPAV